SARAVLASSSISKTLIFDTVKLRLHPAKDADSEENFRSARCAALVTLAKSGDEHDFNSESCFGSAPEFRGSVSILAQVRFHQFRGTDGADCTAAWRAGGAEEMDQ